MFSRSKAAGLAAVLAGMAFSGTARADSGGGIIGWLDSWYDRVDQAQSSQPHWMTPLVTVTPRLEQEFRYDQYFEETGTGASIDSFDQGKGLELIPTTTNEVLINLPPYLDREKKSPASGWGDWPFLTIKQRIASAPEDQGNYIITAFLGLQAPLGNHAFTNHAWIVTPTIAGGKGWGDFDIQGTFGVQIPTDHATTIGTAIVSNVALQYHLYKYFWPEIEFNDTAWRGGSRKGLNQLFMTAGIIFGRFQLGDRTKAIIGTGYQFALQPKLIPSPLTPAYNHNWIISARLAF